MTDFDFARDDYDVDEFNFPTPGDEQFFPEEWEDREDSLDENEAQAMQDEADALEYYSAFSTQDWGGK